MSSMIDMYEDDPLFELANEYGEHKATREDYEEGSYTYYDEDEWYEGPVELTYADAIDSDYDGY